MSRIIIAVDDSDRSQDAVAFGGVLARESGAAVTVAHAYPRRRLGFGGSASASPGPTGEANPVSGPTGEANPVSGPTQEANRLLAEEAEKLLRRMSGPLRDLPGLETRSLADPSPARALHALAEELGAGLVVVGSSHGRLGRVLPGSTAERLLHGSPCPVAIVPHGYRTGERHGLRVIACGWDGSPESEEALAAAEELALRMSASVRVIRALEPSYHPYPPTLGIGYRQLDEAERRQTEQALTQRMAHLPEGVETEGELREARAHRALIDVSEFVDLMVLGSRGYGPIRAVLLGGVSSRVVREAGCPVIVVPNGSRTPLASVFGARPERAVV